jgi:hypothetical protein
MQLSKEIGITQKSAWFMLHRARQLFRGRHGRQTAHLRWTHLGTA